jgi:hypothetical protein
MVVTLIYILILQNNGIHPLENHDAQEHATKLYEIHLVIHAEMSFAQAKRQESVD